MSCLLKRLSALIPCRPTRHYFGYVPLFSMLRDNRGKTIRGVAVVFSVHKIWPGAPAASVALAAHRPGSSPVLRAGSCAFAGGRGREAGSHPQRERGIPDL